MAKTKAVPAKAGKTQNLDELNNLVGQIGQYEAENKDIGSRQFSYLRIVGNSANDPVMKEGKPEYIKGVKEGYWTIPSKKMNLGKSFPVTIVAMFKVYEDSIPGVKKDPKSKQEPMRQVVNYWMPEDAEQVPLEGIFDRVYFDKQKVEHILRPVHWMFLRLHNHPDIDDALLTFRSKGNRVYKETQKLVAQHAKNSCTELRFIMSHQELNADGYDKDYLYPLFEFDGYNYEYDKEAGKITGLVKDGFTVDELTEVLKQAAQLQEDYAKRRMVAKKSNLAAIVQGLPQKALEDKGASYVEDDDEEEAKPKGKAAKF